MKYTWMEIDLDVIARNYQKIKKSLSRKTDIFAVVKADAYGLGAVPVAKKLEEAGCSHFVVTYIEEAVALRSGGINGEILVLMPIEEEEALLAVELELTVTMANVDHAKMVSEKLVQKGLWLRMHIKVDCGLSRMGIVVKNRLDCAIREVESLVTLPGFLTEGIFTHITAAGMTEQGKVIDRSELEKFKELTDILSAKGILLKKHCLCSNPLENYGEYQGDYVRIGSLLYGVNPDKYSTYGVDNCLSLKSRVVQVKTIPPNTPVSYGPIYITSQETKIAIVAVGFSDGLRRALSNVGKMIIHGKKVPIIGKICCDHTILDITGIDEVEEGDVVTLFGEEGDAVQYVGDYADLCHASEPEITSILSCRIPRIYR